MSRNPHIVSLGCRLNIAESATLRERLRHESTPGDDRLTIVNGCAVTNQAMRQTRAAVRRAKRADPAGKVIVTGCAAQVDPAMFDAMPEADAVVGNADKNDIANFRLGATTNLPKLRVSDFARVREHAPHLAAAFTEHARAFVEIQNGCDHACTFCIIPTGRGPSRSVPAGAVVERIAWLVDEGRREVVLTGVDVTSYGHDHPGRPTLGSLVERILTHVPTLPRLRLSSLDGVEIDDALLDILTSEERVMPHVHLSIQSGDDMILKRMKRRHSRAQAIELVARLKRARPQIAIGADLIAGFPTETEAMFEASLDIIDACEIVHGHVFPFSARAGTPAARMPPVEAGAIKQRAKRLRQRIANRKRAFLQDQIGTVQNILVERDGLSGYAPNFARVRLNDPAAPGSIAAARIHGHDDAELLGTTA